jgi:hypothetical protein
MDSLLVQKIEGAFAPFPRLSLEDSDSGKGSAIWQSARGPGRLNGCGKACSMVVLSDNDSQDF